MLSTSVVVLDFETTGLSPRGGDRITEVAALRIHNGQVVDRCVTRVNAGVLHRLAGRVLERHRLPTLDPELLRAVTGWPARDVPTRLTDVLRPQMPSRGRARR